MPELRWALVGLGLLFMAGLALWEWRRSRRRPRTAVHELSAAPEAGERPRRMEPSIDGFAARASSSADSLEVPTIHPVEPVMVGVAAESAVDIPKAVRRATVEPAMSAVVAPAAIDPPREAPVLTRSATVRTLPPIKWPPPQTDQVLSLRIVSASGEALSGRQLRIALEAVGMVPGPQTIYHRVTGTGDVLASAANLVRPGNLDPGSMDAQEFRGLSLFCILPGALPPVRMLEELVAIARSLAHRLAATVQDEHGAELDATRLVELRCGLPADADDEQGPGA
jgi:FtsZ-interacting cell division protein ZipA